jgi:hypothetical protein
MCKTGLVDPKLDISLNCLGVLETRREEVFFILAVGGCSRDISSTMLTALI